MYQVLILAPGAKSANADIDFPSWAPKARALCAVTVLSLTEGTPNTWTVSNKTIVTSGTPGTGEAILYDEDTIHIGDAITTSDLVVVVYIPKGEYSGY